MTIDIMMPFWGDPAHFREAVSSVLSQSVDDWRLVVVDDNYPDPAPMAWFRSLHDRRLIAVQNPRNLGVNGNFRRCLELVEAPWFVLMGCDDVLEPTYVDRMARAIETHPGVGYIQPGVVVIDDRGKRARPLADRVKARYRPVGPCLLEGEELAVSLLRGNWTYFPSLCWRTDLVLGAGFRADLHVALDLGLQIDLAADGVSLLVLDAPLFRYRRHSRSVSSWMADDGSRFAEERDFFTRTATEANSRGWTRAARTARWHLSSRLNALSRIPSAMRVRDGGGIRQLITHIFGTDSRDEPRKARKAPPNGR